MQLQTVVSRAARPGLYGVTAPRARANSRCTILLAGIAPAQRLGRFAGFPGLVTGEGDHTDLDGWAHAISDTASRRPGPVVVVAEGAACLATIRAASLRPGVIAGALLIAPAYPESLCPHLELSDTTPGFSSVLLVDEGGAGLDSAKAWQWALRWNSQLASLGRKRPGLELELLEQLCRRVAAPLVPEAAG